jgi:adenylate kinase
MRIIIFGPQGAGKGTQAAKLVEKLDAEHIATGDLVRAEIKQGTELGQKIQEYNDKGELVPDEIIIEMTKPYLSENDSWILDGFPRNQAQAKALDEALEEINEKVDRVIALEASDEDLVKRLSGRRQSDATGKTYHVEHDPPPKEAARRMRGRSSSVKTTRRGHPYAPGHLPRADRAPEGLLRRAGHPGDGRRLEEHRGGYRGGHEGRGGEQVAR